MNPSKTESHQQEFFVMVANACWNRSLTKRKMFIKFGGFDDGMFQTAFDETILRENNGTIKGVKLIEQATNFFSLEPKEALESFYQLKDSLYAGEEAFLIKVTRKVNIEVVEFEEDLELEYLRNKALSKLTEDEIRALGVEKLAVYNKLKYHNVEETNE